MNTTKNDRPGSHIQGPAASIKAAQSKRNSLEEALGFVGIPLKINVARDELLEEFVWSRHISEAEKLPHKNIKNVLKGDEPWLIMTLIWKETHFPSEISIEGLTAYGLGKYISASPIDTSASVTRVQNIVRACQCFGLIDIRHQGNKKIISSTQLLDKLLDLFASRCMEIVSDL